MNPDSIMPLVVAILGSAGLWTYLKLRSEQSYKASMDARADRAEFNDTLRTQVERLSAKLDKLSDDKEQLLKEIASLRHELGEAKATIKHLEMMLMKN